MNDKNKYWRTTVTVVVLSKGAQPPEFGDLSELHALIDDGPCSGEYRTASEEISREDARAALVAQRSDPDFLDTGAEWGDDPDGEADVD